MSAAAPNSDGGALAVPTRDHVVTARCRYGVLTFPRFDNPIGCSLESYGEWAQDEIDLLLRLVEPGGAVVDAGAYVGSHTIAFSRHVGDAGTVTAIETAPAIFSLLEENVRQNRLANVRLLHCALGRATGMLAFPHVELGAPRNYGATSAGAPAGAAAVEAERAPALAPDEDERPRVALSLMAAVRPLDGLALERVDLVKADVEGMEEDILAGGEATIRRLRPHLYLECRTVEHGRALLGRLRDLAYSPFFHAPFAFNPANFNGNATNLFRRAQEPALLAVARERRQELRHVLGREPRLAPVRTLDDLALGLSQICND